MQWDVAGIGNALMDALVLIDGDEVLDDLGLLRGTMHPVDHRGWQEVFDRVSSFGVTLDSGGSCANTIATLGRLGAMATYYGQIGEDELGRVYSDRLNESCGTSFLRVHPSEATGKCLSLVSRQDAERTMLTDLGASIHLDTLGDYAPVLRNTRVAHFTGYTLLPGPVQGVVTEAMSIAKGAGARISLDVADPFVVLKIRDMLWDIIDRHADIVFLNAEEARALTDEAPERAAQDIAKRARVETIVVKLGSHGSLVIHKGEEYRVGIHKVKAVDTTGAGDAYAGGFLYGYTRGWDPASSGALAARVAAHTVSQVGAVVKDRELLAREIEVCQPR